MVHYFCYRCGYEASQKINLKHHLNRKKICKPILEDISIEEIKKHYNFEINEIPQNTSLLPQNTSLLPQNTSLLPQKTSLLPQNTSILPQNITNQHQCKFCNKVLSRYDNLNRHLKTCKKKKEVETLIISQNEEMIKMKKEIEELKNFKIQTQNNTTNNTSNNNSHNNTNMSKNIIINNYGDENIKHLKYKDYVDILSSKYMCVPNLIEKIHFDSEHPENQNIKYTNKKQPYLKIMKNNKWQFVNKKNELLNLIDDKCFILKEKYYKILEKKKYNITENQREKIEEFMEKYKEDDKQVMLDLIQRTELMLLNNN